MVRPTLSGLALLASMQLGCDVGSSTAMPQPEMPSAGMTAGGGGPGSETGGSASSGGSPAMQPAGTTCQRPAGMAAVSLTYDDALGSHLATAAPALKAHGLKATFFVTDVRGVTAGWAALKADGHELGAHTFKHPCPKSNTWVAPGDANEDYDVARMTTELDEQVALLKEMGQEAPFTFAYPCGIDWIGADHQSYAPLVAERFSAARGVAPGLVKPGVNLANVPATFSTGTAEQLIALADSAKAGGAWVVFGFHGVGGDHTPVTAEAHEALLAYLDEHKSELYVGTFGELASCMSQ
jgi:peptidoglycan-N-acetylglucosamine deacetylase